MSGRGASSLWMGDIDAYMDERVINEAFSMMGEHVMAVKLLKDHKTGQNRNYCFVELTSKEAVNLALRRLNGLPLPNYPAKRFKLNYSLRDHNAAQTQMQADAGSTPSPYGREYSVYVGNLSTSTTDEELLSVFRHYKSIKEAKIVRDDNQKSKGFGFVRFYTEMDQEAAILQMNGAVGPLGVTLKVDKAMPKREIREYGAGTASLSSGSTAAVGAQQQGYPGQYPYQQGTEPYGQTHGQQYNQYPSTQNQDDKSNQQSRKQEEDDEALEEHSTPVNMVATNLAFIQANQDFYQKLAESRWQPVTSYTATIEQICK
ncbi:tRNA selenocysteine 1-associated protein 1-like [Diadema antillarum]|uniref:tRNA selenocysteine 1-associated protein 1-like n=1 Tax=Diadema antillarum TaxID=105358 RepID=UPI003A85958E